MIINPLSKISKLAQCKLINVKTVLV